MSVEGGSGDSLCEAKDESLCEYQLHQLLSVISLDYLFDTVQWLSYNTGLEMNVYHLNTTASLSYSGLPG